MPNAFITGVSSGLGQGLNRCLLQRGWTVKGLSRRAPEEERNHPRFQFASIDLSNVASAFAAVRDFLGETPIDLAILNAGRLGEIRDLRDTDVSELRGLMDINVWANKHILDAIADQPTPCRQVVLISSGASINGHRGWAGYALSKATLNMLAQLYAHELPDTHVSSIAPGLIDTAMQDYLCELPADERYASLGRLRDARGTEAMPDPQTAAERLLDFLPKVLELPSGSFRDIRDSL